MITGDNVDAWTTLVESTAARPLPDLDVDPRRERPAWMHRAACRGHDPAPFFATTPTSRQAAIDICATCPVRAQCLDYALDDPALTGVWGSTDDTQRRAMRRQAV